MRIGITCFTKYARIGASSRYRTFQYLPALAAAGIECKVSPLFGDVYLQQKYARGRSDVVEVLRAFLCRVFAVLAVTPGSTVVVEYELVPFFPALFERWLVWRGCRLVVDFDDALFHQYDHHGRSWVRWLLGGKIATVMRLAELVVVGNSYLAGYAYRAGARRVETIPTVVDLARYPTSPRVASSEVFTIGWIGSPSTARYLQAIAPALAEVCKGGRARVRLIGSGPIALPGVPVEVRAWKEDTEVAELRLLDVGIMPLPDEPWARGKCGLKLIQYMACALPVLASPVGVNAEIVEDGVNGYLADSTEQWVRGLERLRANPELRLRLGQAGRKKIESAYSLEVTAPKLVSLLRSIAGGR